MMYPLAGFERARWEWQESNRLYSPLLGLSREFPGHSHGEEAMEDVETGFSGQWSKCPRLALLR